MILKALKFSDNFILGKWSIKSGKAEDKYVFFENINLIVGRNASGKTRLIDAIRGISDLLESGLEYASKMMNVSFEVIFEDGKDEIKYYLEFDYLQSIVEENLYFNKVQKLDRSAGQLYYEKLGQFVEFETDDEFLAISRRDNIQQPFFTILHNWGKNLAHYSFGGDMGRKKLIKSINNESIVITDFKNSNKVGNIYHQGKKEFGDTFEEIIIEDMKRIEYYLTSISYNYKSDFQHFTVQESDLPDKTYFERMSQGMARAFSLLVQLNYSLMAKIPSCILIDDIGEGLDYERSRSLIELIIKKVEGSNIQLFMTTNDRFVMNSVPLKYWSVIHREGNKSVFYNYQNSQKTFDDFAFTGLNNFDFFATDFYRMGFEEFIETAQ